MRSFFSNRGFSWFFFGLLVFGGWSLAACPPPLPSQEVANETSADSGQTKETSPQDQTVENPPSEPSVEKAAEAVAEAAPDVAPDTTSEAVSPERKPEPIAEAKPEPRPEIRPEPRPEPRPEVKPETTPAEDYSRAGPLAFAAIPRRPLTLPPSTGCSGNFCTVDLEITYPTGVSASRKAPYPLAIVSNGFQLEASRYKSYAERLASWGYIAIRWDTQGENLFSSMTHKALTGTLIEIIAWADAKAGNDLPALKGLIDAKKTYLIGHSRGGKISVLAAQADIRVKAVFGIDPVNSAPPGQQFGTNYPSAFPTMASLQGPLAVVGADKASQGFQPCAPAADNYEKFYNAAPSPAWEILITESGHMQFLDSRSGCLSCFACSNGQTPDATIRSITQTAMIAWGEAHLRAAGIASYLSGSWATGFRSRAK